MDMEFPSENEFYFHNPSPSHCDFTCEEGMKDDCSVSFQSSFSQSQLRGNEKDLCDRPVQVVEIENESEYQIYVSSSRSKTLLVSEDETFCQAHSEQNKYLLQIGFNQAIRSQRQSQSDENVSSTRSRSEASGTEDFNEFYVLGNRGEVAREARNTSNKKAIVSLSKSRHSSDSNCHQQHKDNYSNGERFNGGSSSWLEDIQFKAQYQHFRSIDYASVVNSAVSLDRVEVEPQVIKHIRIQRDDLTAGKEERGSLCWNFPRVKLRRLFNAKSLDDILGRSTKKGTISQHCSESTNSIHNQQGLKNNAHSYSKSNSNLSRDSRSYSNSKIISISPQVLATSTSENNCYTAGATPSVGTSSRSSGGIPLFLAIDRDDTGQSLIVPKHKSKGKSGVGIRGKRNKAGSQTGVKCAKSDNCIHRIVSTACTKFGASSVDNLDSSREKTKRNKSSSEDTDADIDIDNVERHGLNFTLPIPVAVQVKQLERKAENIENHYPNSISKSNSKFLPSAVSTGIAGSKSGEKHPPHHRKKSQVSPGEEKISSPQEGNETILPKLVKTPNKGIDEVVIRGNKETENNSDSENTMPKEKAKLVVANVGYLQRPLSPTPASFPGNISVFPSQSTNSNVFRAQCLNSGGGGVSGTGGMSSGGGSGSAAAASRTNFFSPMSSSDSTNSRKNATSQNQWSLSNSKCVNSAYSYNNYNNSSMSNPVNWNNIGSGSGSGVGGKQIRQRESSSHGNTANNANNENVSAFHFAKSKLDRHGQDDIVNYSPSQSTDERYQNQSGLKFGIGRGHGVGFIGGNRGQTTLGLRTHTTSPTFSHPEQINNNYNAVRISTGQVIPQSQYRKEKERQELEDTTCDNPLTVRGSNPKNGRTALRSLELNNGSPQNSPSDAETETDGMGDLQSPQYVKRTAHMFDSRYSTTQVNGTKADTRRSVDGTADSVAGHHNQPSYLSVSRSVCGYSCLSYNNGTTHTTTAMTGTTTNGISSSPYKSHRTSGVNSDSMSSPYRPATLQTNNGHNVEVREHEISIGGTTLSQGIDTDNSQNQNAGIFAPSRKSNIMEKIERLYGSNAVSSTSLWRRPVPLLQMPSSESEASSRKKSTEFKAVNENIIGDPPGNFQKGEKVIPIFVEGSGKQLSRNGSCKGELDEGHRHIQPIPSTTTSTITVKHSSTSSADKGGDKIRDDLYSKHDILNGNRRQNQNQHTNGYENNLDISSQSFDANVPIADKEPTPPSPAYRSQEEVVSSRSRNASTLVSKSVSPPKIIPNQVSELTFTDSSLPHGIDLDSKTKSLKTESQTDSKMGKDLFRLSGIEEPVNLGETQVKTEDTTDGESKKVFKVVSNLSPGEDDSTELLNFSAKSRNISTDRIVDLTTKENVPCSNSNPEEKNGEYFLKVIQNEKSHIQELIKTAEARLEKLDVSEDSPDYELSGKILAATGKARLLINKKFKQFEGLCNDNIEQRRKGVGSDEPYTTKNEDLEGFWDMVLIQVDQVHSMLKNLDSNDTTDTTGAVLTTGSGAGKKNVSSKKVSTQKSPLGSTSKTAGASASKSSGNAARDEARRRMLAEKRKAMKKQMDEQSPTSQEPTEPDVQIFVPDSVS